MKDTHVNVSNATRSDGTYLGVIKEIAGRGVCPFCPEHLRSYHKRPIKEGKCWWVTESMYPYHPVKHHLLFIHKKHIVDVRKLSNVAWKELFALISLETNKRKIAGGTFAIRFGDTHFTGASVVHLHAHLVQSNPEHKDYAIEKKINTGVLMRIG